MSAGPRGRGGEPQLAGLAGRGPFLLSHLARAAPTPPEGKSVFMHHASDRTLSLISLPQYWRHIWFGPHIDLQ